MVFRFARPVPRAPPMTPPFPVLFSQEQIQRRAFELVREIQAVIDDEPPILIAVIEGARPFARLIQQGLADGLPVFEVRAKSYAGTESTGDVKISPVGGAAPDVRGKRVLLLEDIVDTGRTMAALRAYYGEQGAREVRVATLLSKPSRRVVDVQVEHIGFEIPDEFVLGFGMDLDGRYRELRDVVIYDAEVERAHAAG